MWIHGQNKLLVLLYHSTRVHKFFIYLYRVYMHAPRLAIKIEILKMYLPMYMHIHTCWVQSPVCISKGTSCGYQLLYGPPRIVCMHPVVAVWPKVARRLKKSLLTESRSCIRLVVYDSRTTESRRNGSKKPKWLVLAPICMKKQQISSCHIRPWFVIDLIVRKLWY